MDDFRFNIIISRQDIFTFYSSMTFVQGLHYNTVCSVYCQQSCCFSMSIIYRGEHFRRRQHLSLSPVGLFILKLLAGSLAVLPQEADRCWVSHRAVALIPSGGQDAAGLAVTLGRCFPRVTFPVLAMSSLIMRSVPPSRARASCAHGRSILQIHLMSGGEGSLPPAT